MKKQFFFVPKWPGPVRPPLGIVVFWWTVTAMNAFDAIVLCAAHRWFFLFAALVAFVMFGFAKTRTDEYRSLPTEEQFLAKMLEDAFREHDAAEVKLDDDDTDPDE